MLTVLGDWWYKRVNPQMIYDFGAFNSSSYAYPVIVGNKAHKSNISLDKLLTVKPEQLKGKSYKSDFGLVFTANLENLYKLPAARRK
jgi:hypothetical protein